MINKFKAHNRVPKVGDNSNVIKSINKVGCIDLMEHEKDRETTSEMAEMSRTSLTQNHISKDTQDICNKTAPSIILSYLCFVFISIIFKIMCFGY